MTCADTTTIKIPRETTGLNAALFLHLECDQDRTVSGVQISEQGKLGNTQVSALIDRLNSHFAEIFETARAGRASEYPADASLRTGPAPSGVGSSLPLLVPEAVYDLGCEGQ